MHVDEFHFPSSDLLDELIEAAASLPETTATAVAHATVDRVEKDERVFTTATATVTAGKRTATAASGRQLSIRDFFKGPKRKLEWPAAEEDENGDGKAVNGAAFNNKNIPPKLTTSFSLAKLETVTPCSAAASCNQQLQQQQQQQPSTAKRPLPSFKWIPGSRFVVDAFNYGPLPDAQAYFLTHFHSDHYRGLNGRFWHGAPEQLRMYCSGVTGNLAAKELRVPEERIVRLEVGRMYRLDEAWGVGVLDANHCPGSVMFVFWDRAQDRFHLHTGDFRFHRGLLEDARLTDHESNQELQVTEMVFDHVFLDTTYARPDYAFPSQDEVIAACISGCQSVLIGHAKAKLEQSSKKWLFAVGSYLIGKERIVLALAEFFGWKIYADERKRAVLMQLEWPELTGRLTDDPGRTPLHIVSMALLSKQKLNDYRIRWGFSRALGIRPTGWSFSSGPGASAAVAARDKAASASLSLPKLESPTTIWSLPYSEHSSYAELGQFLRQVTFKRVVPTVDNWKGIGHDVAKCNYNTDLLLRMISNKR